MKLYIQELSAPRLFLAVPEAQALVLKSTPAPMLVLNDTPAPVLYLEKAKYTKREGSPGSYRYTYAKDSTGGSDRSLPGMEGPFTFAGGRELYYDNNEGEYYDRGSDMYLTADEATIATSTTPKADQEKRHKQREKKEADQKVANLPIDKIGSHLSDASGARVKLDDWTEDRLLISLNQNDLDLKKIDAAAKRFDLQLTIDGRDIVATKKYSIGKSIPEETEYQRLVKAKYTKREGSPGSYRYTYAKEGGSKPHIPEQQMGFEFNENASSQEIADVLNKLKPSERDQDFLTLSEELERHGIAADTKMIGEAFDAGLVKPGMRPHVENSSREDLIDHIKQKLGGRTPQPSQDRHAGPKDIELNTWDEPEVAAKVEAIATELGMDFENNDGMLQLTQDPMKIYSVGEIDRSIARLYLDLSKGNPNREPAMGQFIGGGAGKAHGQGQEDLTDQMFALLDLMPGEDIEKEDTKPFAQASTGRD